MSAKDNLNPDQLRMFMRPGEIMNMVTDSPDRHSGDTMGDHWDVKAQQVAEEPEFQQLKRSIKKHGVKSPVSVYVDFTPWEDSEGSDSWTGSVHPFALNDGHHRVVIADQLERETGKHVYLPVTYEQF